MTEIPGGGIPGSAGGLGRPEDQPGPRRESNTEIVRRYNEASIDRLPVGAERIISTLMSAEVREGGDVTELRKAVDNALAYREGLTFGVKGAAYEFEPKNPRDRIKIATIEKKFATTEDSLNRPGTATPYINAALEDALDGRIQRAQEYHDDPTAWQTNIRMRIAQQNEIYKQAGRVDLVLGDDRVTQTVEEETQKIQREYDAIPKLIELRGLADTRNVLDEVFQLRQRTCENPELAKEVGGQYYCPTPDGMHWVTLFQGETTADYGKGVADAFEEIVKMGLHPDVVARLGMEPIPVEVRQQVKQEIYARGFVNAVAFGTWMNDVLKRTEGRMDEAWQAWRLALSWEVIDTLGVTTEKVNIKDPISKETKIKEKYVFATPPIGNALFTFINHLKEKRKLEYGLYTDGTRFSTEKFVGHSGLPMSIDHIPNLCSDYLHKASIEFNAKGLSPEVRQNLLRNLPTQGMVDYEEDYGKLRKSLEDLAKDPNKKVKISLWDIWLYGRVGLADPKFPWFQTDQPSADDPADELEPGSFGFWLLTRSRSAGILESIKSQPSLRDVAAPDFFSKIVRNWTKVLGPVKEDMKPEDNPRVWWVAGLIHLHQTNLERPGIKPNPKIDEESKYHWSQKNEGLSISAKGMEDKGVAVNDIFYNAVLCGFLRPKDVDWIKNKLDIKTVGPMLS